MARQVHGDVGERWRQPVGSARVALARGVNRLLEHLCEQVKADRAHVARLLGAEQASRAADLEVAHSDAHAAAELGVLVERRQARLGLLGQVHVVREHEIRVRLHR